MATFQERLNEALQFRDITPAELSRLSEVNEGAISQYRSGAYKASQRSLDRLAKTLNVSIAWLMGADVPIGTYTAQFSKKGLRLGGLVDERIPNYSAKLDGICIDPWTYRTLVMFAHQNKRTVQEEIEDRLYWSMANEIDEIENQNRPESH